MSAPERIWLQWGHDLPGAPDPYLDDVTWCDEQIDDDDVGYVRTDVHAADVERLERYLFAARASCTTLESELKAVTAARDAYAEEVGRLAHRLAALEEA